MKISNRRNAATDALWQVRNQVTEVEPVEAGFRFVHFDAIDASWHELETTTYHDAIKARTRVMAAKALEQLGADPVEARAAAKVLPMKIGGARRIVEMALPIVSAKAA